MILGDGDYRFDMQGSSCDDFNDDCKGMGRKSRQAEMHMGDGEV